MMKKILITLFLSSVVVLSVNQSAFAMRQPAMERSLQILQNAERVLRKARPNKGGHRYKALKHIQEAMHEIREGIEFANRRPAGGQLKQRKRMEPVEPESRRHEYGEREYTEQDEHEKEMEYLRNRY
jgi:Ni/Co efflux regulator RcnB